MLDGSSGFPGPHLSIIFNMLEFQVSDISENGIFEKDSGILLVFLCGILVSPKLDIIVFGSHGHVKKFRKT